MTAANLLGLYYVAFPFHVIYFKSSLQPKSTVPTTFCILGKHYYGIELSFLFTLDIYNIFIKSLQTIIISFLISTNKNKYESNQIYIQLN